MFVTMSDMSSVGVDLSACATEGGPDFLLRPLAPPRPPSDKRTVAS